jgi:uncharacterized membrane protein YbhN (UPF0104 family)
MKKIVGILIAVAGFVVFALSFAAVRTGFKIVLPAMLNDNILMIIGAVLLIAGAYLGFGKGGKKKMSEVPIYHGDNVVGFRRMGK